MHCLATLQDWCLFYPSLDLCQLLQRLESSVRQQWVSLIRWQLCLIFTSMQHCRAQNFHHVLEALVVARKVFTCLAQTRFLFCCASIPSMAHVISLSVLQIWLKIPNISESIFQTWVSQLFRHEWVNISNMSESAFQMWVSQHPKHDSIFCTSVSISDMRHY